MSEPMKIKLDRTLCDGFGICARHAPEYFSLDDWDYASLIGDGTVPENDRGAVTRALLDCPAHAIIALRATTNGSAVPAPEKAGN